MIPHGGDSPGELIVPRGKAPAGPNGRGRGSWFLAVVGSNPPSPPFGVTLGSPWDYLGHLGVTLGSPWGHFEVTLGSCWGHVGVMLESFWGHVGVILTPHRSGYSKNLKVNCSDLQVTYVFFTYKSLISRL